MTGISFNAGEVLEIAQQIERNGARFYRRAAEAASTSRCRRTFEELAAMEDDHERVFASMWAALSPQERQEAVYDPYDEGVQYLRALAGGHIFDWKADPAEWIKGRPAMTDILQKAVEIEKDSIIYYLGLKEVVPERLGRARVEDIIREEMKHLTLLETMMGFPEEPG